MKNLKKMFFSASFCVFSGIIFSQTKINLETAIETALKNNTSLKNEQLKSDYKKQLIKTSVAIAPVNVYAEYGQINSFYNDTKFGISQTLNFPSVYTNQRKLLTQEWQAAILDVSVKNMELKSAVTNSFYTLIYLSEKQKLLQRSDSIFSEFLKKSELRFNKGESNILEKTTAQTQQGSIKIQLAHLAQERELTQLQLQLLLNDTQDYIPISKSFKIEFDDKNVTTFINNHATIKLLELYQKIAEANTSLEKSKLLPNFTIGYNNNSFIGNGADNVLYDKNNRFHSAQIGLGIPIFGGLQTARIKASKIAETIAENELNNQKTIFKNKYEKLIYDYQKNIEKINYFEKTAIPNTIIIEATANKQFYNGEINYLDWTLLINQSISIKNDYIDSVMEYNQTIIQLNYILSK